MSKCKFCGTILSSEGERLNHIELHLEQALIAIKNINKLIRTLDNRTLGSIKVGGASR